MNDPQNVTAPYSGPGPSSGGTCPSCNSPLADGQSFCAACGAKLAEARQGPACPSCNAINSPFAKFCIACGSGMGAPTAEPEVDLEPLDVDVDMSGIKLVQLDESGSPVVNHTLKGAETTIGREDADITFADDTYMSPLHAQISVRGSELEIRDLGSRNGTWVFIEEPYLLQDGDRILIGSQIITFRRLGYPGPQPPELDQTRRLGSLTPNADIAVLTQIRGDGSRRDQLHLSPGRNILMGREQGDWTFPYDPSMSGAHAEIRSEDADFVLADVGSRNGTAVSVRGERKIRNASRFLVGDKMLRVEMS